MEFSVGILIVSDTCSNDASLDKTTAAIVEYLHKYNSSPGVTKKYKVSRKAIVPDNSFKIQFEIKKWTSGASGNVDLVLTSGGTGFTDHDRTPEAVKGILEKEAPGIVHAMLSSSLKITPFAMMARPVAGVTNKSLIVTLPGSPKGAIENLNSVVPTLAHALAQIGSRDARALHAKMERTYANAPPGYDDNVQSTPSIDEFAKPNQTHDHEQSGKYEDKKAHTGTCGIAKHQLVSNNIESPVTQRARSSPYAMISMKDAFEAIRSHAITPTTIEIDIRETDPTGYVFAENITSPINVPQFRASIVDGYAVKTEDGPGTYKVVSISHASPTDKQHHLQRGEISRITTGAPVPIGADAVVMVEETKLVSTKDDGEEEFEVEILAKSVEPNDNIREVGSDIQEGELMFSKGALISGSGGEVGILSSMGLKKIKVFKKPVIGVLSTGDELVDTFSNEKNLQYGQIFDSNRPTLLNAIKNTHFHAVDLNIAGDTKTSLEEVIKDAFLKHDIDYLITTGGVSMGEMDLLKPIIERSLKGTIHFGRVKMKPGKPTTFATFEDDQSVKKTIFALPGNPASAAVCYYLFVLPSLKLFSGYCATNENIKFAELPNVRANLLADAKLDPRPEYQRVIVSQDDNGMLLAKNTGFQRSSRIASFRDANGLIVLPSKEDAGRSILKAGEEVNVMLFGPISTL